MKRTSLSDHFIDFARKVLPMPFTIAVLLTFLAIFLVLLVNPQPPEEEKAATFPLRMVQILGFWEMGFWELLEFAMQMTLILVLGHALALTAPAGRLIGMITGYCTNTANSAAIVTFSAIVMGLFNWGLGLIFGAILARRVAENALRNQWKINYPLIAASGYAGLMVWHGGLSGSAPLTVATPGHFLHDLTGVIPPELTIFSKMNMVVILLLLLLVPAVMYFSGKNLASVPYHLDMTEKKKQLHSITGAGRLDNSKIITYLFAGMIILVSVLRIFTQTGATPLSFLSLNFVNFMLFGLGLLMHGSFKNYVSAIDEAVGGASGIIIQFPIYAGIMGIMKYSGLIYSFSDFFIGISSEVTLPLFTFFSAALVNVFVPSGGGQWAVQGPVVIQSAIDLGVPVHKNIMALSYGDQITNMIQPFWALPLLGITGLQAKDILPYTLILLLVGIVIFLSALLIF